MNEQIKKVVDPLKSFWSNLSSKAKKLVKIGAGAILAAAIIASIIMNIPRYTVLYSSLDDDEAQEVIEEIESRNIDYKEKDGTIYVPQDEEEALRMDLSNAGHPYSTYNYDFFLDNVDVMTTESEQKILEKYQLNQKLESVIKSISSVKNASVTINLDESSGYVLTDDTEEASAGVAITLNSGAELTSTEVLGIKRLIAKSVPNLDEDNVVVINTATGAEFDSDDSISMDMASFKLLIQNQYESDIENKIGTILNPIFGAGNYEIAAKSDIDVDKSVKEIITYEPSENNRGVITSESHEYNTTSGSDTASGVAGTDSNTDDSTTTYSAGVSADGDTIYMNGTDSYEYLVSQVTEQVQKDSAEVLDLTVSVAVNAANMSDAQKNEIAKLVANSAGVSQDSVYVFNTQFASSAAVSNDTAAASTVVSWIQAHFVLVLAVAGGLLLLIILLAVIGRIRAARRMRYDEYEEEENGIDVLSPRPQKQTEETPNPIDDPDLEDFKIGGIKVVKESKTQALKHEIQEFSSQNPEIAAQLIRTWLKGDDGNA